MTSACEGCDGPLEIDRSEILSRLLPDDPEDVCTRCGGRMEVMTAARPDIVSCERCGHVGYRGVRQ